MLDTFEDIAADIARRLKTGADDRRSGMHTGVVATTDADARVMVLRGYDPAIRTLRFHTDIRSPKCALIGEGAPVGVLFYDKQERIQLRCKGIGRIEHATQAADAAWTDSDLYARRCYMGAGPGAVSDTPTSGLPEWIEGEKPTEEQVAPSRENFALLLVTLTEVDWFTLSNEGHRRAVIDMQSGAGQWVAP